MKAGNGRDTIRLRLKIAYHGQVFRGWQSQAGGGTVQDHIEQSLAILCGYRAVVHGAGRTDAGVHALQQVAHVDVPDGRFSMAGWQAAINAHLPVEIRVLRLAEVPQSFHARFGCRGKTYIYRIWNDRVLHPMEIGRAWHVPGFLDLDLLRRGAETIKGTHDFAGFAANRGKPPKDTRRTLREVSISKRGSLVTVRFTGDGFLYRMVRLLTGTIVRTAQHRASESRVSEILSGAGTTKTSFAAPADGLYLARVFY